MIFGQLGFFDVKDRYKRLSDTGDPPEKFVGEVGWELFHKPLLQSSSGQTT